MARYLLKFGSRELSLHPGKWRIGRDPDCEVRIDSAAVSRHHATLDVHESQVMLWDHESINGVRVNGNDIVQCAELHLGDVISIGRERFQLVGGCSDLDVPTKELPLLEDTSKGDEGLALLSPREREVLAFFAEGYSQREIAQRIGISVKTVETYRARVGEKLGLDSRSELVRFALKHGLLKAD